MGRGACLEAEEPGCAAHYMAPPGVPLQLPETIGMLRQWRIVHIEDGEMDGPVSTLSFDEALRQAPSQRTWIEDQAMLARSHEEASERRSAARRQSAEGSTADSSLGTPFVNLDRRRITTLTQSASTFSSLLESLPEEDSAVRVEGLVKATSSRSKLRAEFQATTRTIGRQQAREVIVALLHARARTHSWRWTKLLRRFEPGTQLERLVGREIDAARTGDEVLERLAGVNLRTHELDDVLISLLYVRSHGPRWRMTHPLRLWLGSHRFSGLRGVLRRRAVRHRQGSEPVETYY